MPAATSPTMIHPDLTSARAAVLAFVEVMNRMQEAAGISLEIDDSCVGSWWTAQYYDADGKVQKFFYD